METSSVFLVTTRGSAHHPRGEGDEMAKSRDPTFTLTFSRKYSPGWRAWEGSEEYFTAAKRIGKCYKRASELNNRAQCKISSFFGFFCSKRASLPALQKQKSLQMGLDNISEETCVVPGSV